MSLHALANHLQQAGRGDDKVLIHMTPKEVNGLQSLAMAHGGSLTINPQTGLPEAGFLSRLLPTIIGAGLMLIPGMQPLGAAAITGAGYGIAKGSLKEGLMAGLGAYGGAGLTAGLNTAGAAATGANTAANATNIVPSAQGAAAANNLSSSYSGANVVNAGSNTGALSASQPLNLSQPIIRNYPVADLPNASAVMSRGFATPLQATEVALKAPVAVAPDVATVAAKEAATKVAPVNFDNIKAGFGKATNSWDDLKSVWKETPTGTGYGLAATGMGIMQDAQNKGIGPTKASDSYIRPYDYSVSQNESAYAPNASTSERMYFNQPRFTARPIEKIAKEGGLLSLAVGGQPEREAAYQAVSMNDSYPMAQLKTPMYSDPSMQRPMAREVVNPSGDVGVDDFTGQPRMAKGGVATPSESTERKYSYNPETMKFTALNTPEPAAPARLFKGFSGGMGGGMGGSGFGGGLIAQLLAKQQAPAAAPVAGETTGGIAAPYIPEGQAMGMQNTSMVPNIEIPPMRTPEQQLGLEAFYDNMNQRLAQQGGYAAGGGVSTLGGYSDGGRLLRGPGDGVSDSIPASIGNRQPARLADGEFVVPARIVSEIGNGSTEAGARKLYAMMERVQRARRKTTGKNQVAKNTKAERLLPA
jgi:hypothetical protein